MFEKCDRYISRTHEAVRVLPALTDNSLGETIASLVNAIAIRILNPTLEEVNSDGANYKHY